MAAPLQLADNPWEATAIADEDGELQAPIEEADPFISFEGDQAAGDGSCNRFAGSYESSESGDLSFGDMALTMMACLESIMIQEQAFLAALGSVDAFSIAGSSLEMRSSGDVVLLFEAIPTSLANTSWNLIALNNGKEAVVTLAADTEITAMFTEDGTMAGSSGCNTYRATWATEGESIDMGPPMGTKKMCEGEGVMEQEARFLELLGLATRYRLDTTTLEMFDDEGARQLQFNRAED